ADGPGADGAHGSSQHRGTPPDVARTGEAGEGPHGHPPVEPDGALGGVQRASRLQAGALAEDDRMVAPVEDALRERGGPPRRVQRLDVERRLLVTPRTPVPDSLAH